MPNEKDVVKCPWTSSSWETFTNSDPCDAFGLILIVRNILLSTNFRYFVLIVRSILLITFFFFFFFDGQ